MQQDVRTNSTVGATVTSVNRDGATPGYAASVDGTLKWRENAYRMFTRFSGSRTGAVDERVNGYEAAAYFSKFSGWLGGQLYADARSQDFNVSDLGFMNRGNRIQSGGHIYAQIQEPWALARKSGFNLNAWSHWNYDGVGLKKGINFNNWHDLKNRWWFNFGVSREFEAMDDLGTRGGPLMVSPAHIWWWANLSTDSRKLVSFHLHSHGNRKDEGMGWQRSLSIGANFRPASNIQFELRPSYDAGLDSAQWVTNVDSDDDGEDDHFVFGELERRVLNLRTRLNVAFTTNLTLQLYFQSFVATGDYSDFKELARTESYEFTPYAGLDENPDFSRRSLRGNMVLRWEYRPGSTLFLVWSQSRSESFDLADPDFEPFTSVRESFTDEGENIFLVKLNYWLGI